MSGDPYRYFRVEARELVTSLGESMLELERGAAASVVAPRVLRLAHTLKGAARVVRQAAIAEHAHAIEEVVSSLAAGEGAVDRGAVDDVLRRLDAIAALVAAIDRPQPEPGAPASAAAASPPSTRSDEPHASVRVDREDVERLLRSIADAERELQAVRGAAVPDDGHGGSTGARAALDRALERLDREVLEVRDAAERLLLSPVRQLRPMLARAVRDAARALGREAELTTSGDDLRLDAAIVADAGRALEQIVRNAVAHGIESPDDRRRAGKPRVGRVELRTERRGEDVAFVVRDDGAGIDVRAVRALAARRGVRADHLSDEDVPSLLLGGGLSTSTSITEVAGRGIGLDLVREVAGRLGGHVRVSTDAGRGTTVELAIPAVRAALRALLAEAAGVVVAIPLASVVEVRRVTRDDVRPGPSGDAIPRDGDLLPLASLAAVMGREAPRRRGERAASVVVVRHHDAAAAVRVDRVVGTQEVVVRPLPPLATAAAWVAGATVERSGGPRLVVDPAALVRAASAAPAERDDEAPRLPVLVVDDSLTTRMLEKSILEGAGYDVDLAACGEEGLRKARERRHLVFLVDVEMPDMDGFTFVERTRADPELARTPAILVTSRNAPEDRARGEAAGAAGYVVKADLDPRELLHMIERLTG